MRIILPLPLVKAEKYFIFGILSLKELLITVQSGNYPTSDTLSNIAARVHKHSKVRRGPISSLQPSKTSLQASIP